MKIENGQFIPANEEEVKQLRDFALRASNNHLGSKEFPDFVYQWVEEENITFHMRLLTMSTIAPLRAAGAVIRWYETHPRNIEVDTVNGPGAVGVVLP